MQFRPRRMTENEFLLIEWGNVAKGVENDDMKHEKEWHTCDRCGKDIKHTIMGFMIGRTITDNSLIRKNYDLCPECLKDFERFMKNE